MDCSLVKCADVAGAIVGCDPIRGCYIASCTNALRGDCNYVLSDGCESELVTIKHCGKCGIRCPLVANGVSGCVKGQCVIVRCNPGFGNCDRDMSNGCETNLLASSFSCGKCGNVCTLSQSEALRAAGTASAVEALVPCVNGVCETTITAITCPTGWANCDADPSTCETNIATGIAHCGSCTNVCAQLPQTLPPLCVNGICTQPTTCMLNCAQVWCK